LQNGGESGKIGTFPGKNATAREVVSFLEKNGFRKVRQKGSHATYKDNLGHAVQVPIHSKPIDNGTLKSIRRQAEFDKK
jgi:predicted RNA binding protein YcfA (HicA-like mRNA interferase family)